MTHSLPGDASVKIVYFSLDTGVPLNGPKGSSVHVRELVNALAACGNQVTIFAANVGEALAPLRARVIEVDGSGPPDGRLPGVEGAGALPWDLEEDWHHVAVVDRLRRLQAQEGFDPVYERYSLWSAAGVRAAKLLNVPCLVEVNAPLVEKRRRYGSLVRVSEAKAIEADVLSRADAILAVSEGVKAYVLANGADPLRTVVIPNGVDVSRFHPAVESDVGQRLNGRFVMGFVGSLQRWHGIEILVQVIRTLLRRSDDYRLLIVGDGVLRSWLESQVEALGLDKAVTLTGPVPHDRVPGLIRRMDVALAPYPLLENFYFSPLKLFEYMAVGTPVVGSRIGQIQEVVRDGETGLLVPPGDPQALVDQIERLRRDQNLREELGRAAALQARNYTWERNARQVAAIGERLLRTRGQ